MAVAWCIRMVDWRTPYLPFWVVREVQDDSRKCWRWLLWTLLAVGLAMTSSQFFVPWWLVGSWPAVVRCHVRSGQVPIRRMAGMTEPDFMSDTKITSKALKHLNWNHLKPLTELENNHFEDQFNIAWLVQITPSCNSGLKKISASWIWPARTSRACCAEK